VSSPRGPRPAGGLADDEAPIVIRPSGWFVASSVLSPLVLLALGGWGLLATEGLAWLPTGLFVVGAVLAVIVAADLPVRSELGPDGVERVCPLRRQRVPWDDVVAVGRTRVDRGPQRLLGRAVTGGGSRKRGGLVLEVGPKRRRYLLTDRQERLDQHHELRRLVPRWAPGVPLPAEPR
jgi:hypothetical protein